MQDIDYFHGHNFRYTATGKLGTKRCSMLANELHQRAQLAKSKPHCHNIPHSNYVYGIKTVKKESVQDAFNWKSNVCEATPLTQKPPIAPDSSSFAQRSANRDFIALNREAIKAGLVGCTEVDQFRATHEVRRKPAEKSQAKSLRRTSSVPVCSSTDNATWQSDAAIGDLMAYRYQDQWIKDRARSLSSKSSQRYPLRSSSARGCRQYDTRATLLKSFVVPLEPSPLWKLKRFDNKARPCLNTFRTDCDRQAALRNHQSDKLARSGLHGHGVYANL